MPYLYAGAAIAVTAMIVAFPKDSFEASLDGLRVWWEIVFPALLPFFVAAEVLMGLGVVHMLGVLLEPLMRPLFNVPGAGAFALAMGLASGYPMGAKITAELRSRRMCSQIEAERLLSITNTADPLFMTGAVAVGMLGDPRLGIVIVLSHYAASILLGLIIRFYGGNEQEQVPYKQPARTSLLRRAADALVSARESDGRPIGQLLGDAVRDSVTTLLLVGGFIIVFSVMTRVLSAVGVTHLIATPLSVALRPFGVDPSILDALVEGFFEITIGCEEASRATTPLETKLIAISAIIGWSGLSVCGQVASIVHETGIRLRSYVSSRIIHAALAACICALLLRPGLSPLPAAEVPVSALSLMSRPSALNTLVGSTRLLLGVSAFTAVTALFVSLPLSLRVITFRHSGRK